MQVCKKCGKISSRLQTIGYANVGQTLGGLETIAMEVGLCGACIEALDLWLGNGESLTQREIARRFEWATR